MTVGFLGAELPRWDQLLREGGQRPSCLGLPFFEDERPLRGVAGLCDWRLGGRLSRLLGAGAPEPRLRGSFGDKLLLPTGEKLPFGRLVLFGLGAAAAFTEERARVAGRELLATLHALGGEDRARAASIVPPGRSTGALSARQALAILLEAADVLPEGAGLLVVESVAGQREAADLVRRPLDGGAGRVLGTETTS